MNRVLHVACGLGSSGGVMSYARSVASLDLGNWKQQIWKHRDFVASDSEMYVCEGSAKLSDRRMFQDLLYGLVESRSVRRWIDGVTEPTILHAHSRVGLLAAGLASRGRRLPTILHIHKLPGKPEIYRALARWSRSRLVFNSRRTADWMGHTSPNETILYPFIEWPDAPAPAAPGVRLVAAGSFARVKRFDLLIKATEILRSHNCDIPLVIYGRARKPPLPAHQPLLEKLAAEVPGVQLRDYSSTWRDELREGDLFVHTCSQEAFGIVILEAYARGCRVLIPNGIFLPELGESPNMDGITMSSMEGAKELADAILRAISVPANSAEFWAVRKQSRAIFEPSAAAAELDTLYTQMLADRR